MMMGLQLQECHRKILGQVFLLGGESMVKLSQILCQLMSRFRGFGIAQTLHWRCKRYAHRSVTRGVLEAPIPARSYCKSSRKALHSNSAAKSTPKFPQFLYGFGSIHPCFHLFSAPPDSPTPTTKQLPYGSEKIETNQKKHRAAWALPLPSGNQTRQ